MKTMLVALICLLVMVYSVQATDFDGDGRDDVAIFRPSSGMWSVRGLTRTYFGSTGDVPFVGDYDGDGSLDYCIYRGSVGLWAIRNVTYTYFGSQSDVPITGGVTNISQFTAGDIPIAQSTSMNYWCGTSYRLLSEAQLGLGGTISVSFRIYPSSASGIASGQIYRNGQPVGTEFSTATTDPGMTFSDDISGWNAGDLVQLYCKRNGSGCMYGGELTIKVGPGGPYAGITNP